MKTKTLSVVCLLFCFNAFAAESPIRVSVLRFNQEVDHVLDGCHGWVFTSQNQLQSVMERELSKRRLQVLERRDIRKMYDDEFGLPNQDRKSVPRKGGFLSAQYTVTGAITELGICEQGRGGRIQLGGLISLAGGPAGSDLALGGGEKLSSVKLVAQVVSTETGEILGTFEAAREIKGTSTEVSFGIAGIGAGGHSRGSPPIERATNEAIEELAEKISTDLRSRNPIQENR